MPASAVALSASGADGSPTGVVRLTEFQGERWHLMVDTRSGVVHVESEVAYQAGESVALAVEVDRVITIEPG